MIIANLVPAFYQLRDRFFGLKIFHTFSEIYFEMTLASSGDVCQCFQQFSSRDWRDWWGRCWLSRTSRHWLHQTGSAGPRWRTLQGETIIIIRFLSLVKTHFVALVQWRLGWPWCRRRQSISPPWRGQWRLPLSGSSRPAGGRAEWRAGRTWWQWPSRAGDRSRWGLAWWLWTNLRVEIWWQTRPSSDCSYWRSRTTGWKSWSDWRLSKISPG